MNVLVLVLLELGLTGREIARLTGLSEYQVSVERRRLGRSAPTRAPRIDWAAVRMHYDASHSASACKRKFGLSAGAWCSAVARGDIVPREPAKPQFRHERRIAVEQMLKAGLSQAEIARRLGISTPTVSYHVKRLGRGGKSAFARRYDWSAIRDYYEAGHSYGECRVLFGFSAAAWSDAVKRGDIELRPAARPLETVLVAGRRTNRWHLRRRLVAEGLKDNCCERCGFASWNGRPLALELHHRNGDGSDNRLENLQILCPNCHSQTDNWGGRNARRVDHVNGRSTSQAEAA